VTQTLDAAWYASTFETVKNWGRWGADDERGALNLLDAGKVAAAAALVTTGRHVSCALDLDTRPSPDNPHPAEHHMLAAGDACDVAVLPGLQQTSDWLGVACHGVAVSHIDALCHVLVDGRMYNGFPASEVMSTGARRNSVLSAGSGIVGRGVLLDIPRVLGVEWLEPAHRITPAELEAAESDAGLRVGEGDLVLVSTGRARFRRTGGGRLAGGLAGLDSHCIPWLRDRDIAVLGSDAISDAFGAELVPGWPMPIHQCLIAGMGVHLLDNLDLAPLADECATARRWQFLLMVGPMRLPGGTGCAVNPVAVF
jgi:kynurenine formamidase